jgi:ribosomal-protein-alanine N-acetyltransferase
MIHLFDEIPHLEDERIILKKLEKEDAKELKELTQSKKVYRYLPTFLFEQQYEDTEEVIEKVYEDLFNNKESIILGVYLKKNRTFCGLAELYGLNERIYKISIGYRLLEKYWGRGIATEVVALMVDYLYSRTEIEIITASTMVENKASARVLTKNGFIMTSSGVEEDWGYEHMTIADKWFR